MVTLYSSGKVQGISFLDFSAHFFQVPHVSSDTGDPDQGRHMAENSTVIKAEKEENNLCLILERSGEVEAKISFSEEEG